MRENPTRIHIYIYTNTKEFPSPAMFDGRRVKAVCSFSFSRLSRHVLVTALPGFLDANDELE